MSINQFSACNYTASHACAESNHDEVLHLLCSAVHHFTDSCCVCIVGERNGKMKFIFNQFCKRNNSFPRKIWSILDGAGIKITVWCTYTNTFHSARATGFFNQRLKTVIQSVYERLYLIMNLGGNLTREKNITIPVNNPKLGSGTTNVYSNGERLE